MSETQNPIPDSKSKENIEAEESQLDAIQTANALTMSEPIGDSETSIAEKVRKHLKVEPNQRADLMVAVGELEDDERQPIGEKIWVRAEVYGQAKTVMNVPAAEVRGEEVLPMRGFTTEEALALNGMVMGLKEAKKAGALSLLDSSLHSINKPYTGIMAYPPVKNDPAANVKK